MALPLRSPRFLGAGEQPSPANPKRNSGGDSSSMGAAKEQESQSEEKADWMGFFCFDKALDPLLPQQISFQKNFLAQHIRALETLLSKSEEFGPPAPESTTIPSSREAQDPALGPNFPISIGPFIRTHFADIPEVSLEEWLDDLKAENDLNSLLLHIVRRYSAHLARCLVGLARDLWGQVRTFSLRDLEIKDLSQLADKFTTKKCPEYEIRADFDCLLSSDASQSSFPTSSSSALFRKRVEGLAFTLLLVAGGFFENPYAGGRLGEKQFSSRGYLKRQSPSLVLGFLSEQESFSGSEFELEPCKKVKQD